MAGIKTSFKFKAFFGRIPKTADIEKREADLIQEFNELQEFEASQELKDFLELEKIVTSKAFTEKLNAIKAEKFEGTKEHKKEQEFLSMKKSKEIKKYFKFLNSEQYSRYNNLTKSADFNDFGELEKIVEKKNLLSKKKELEQGSEDLTTLEKYLEIKNSSDFKFFSKLKKSSKFQNFSNLHDSEKLKKYNELEIYVNSDEFKEFKAEMTDKERYKKSDEYKQFEQYESTKSDAKFVQYFKNKNSNKFDELLVWEETFSDDFEGKELDRSKWMTNYYWGKNLLNDTYSLANDKHFLTDGKNLEFKDSILSIVTKKATVEGKVWDKRFGFLPKQFHYTSGLISTGESFRQQYGVFKAKIKFNSTEPVYHAFWMLSNKMIPEIDIAKATEKGKLSLNNFWGQGVNSSISPFSGSKFKNDFFIYTLEWTAEKLVWKINDIVVKEQTEGAPKESMYILFSSGLQTEEANNLPAKMEIDWVRCYKKK